MSRGLRILLWVVGVLVVLFLGLMLFLQSGWLRGFAERSIAAATGREVSIGALDISFGRCLHLAIDDLRIANPEWAQTDELANAGRIRACIAYLPLFGGRAHIRSLELADTRAGLERDQGRATWQFAEEEREEGPTRVTLNNASIRDTTIYFRDTEQRTELQLDIAGGMGEARSITVHAHGKVREAEIEAVANSPAALPSPEAPVVVSAALTLGRTTAAAAGRLQRLGLEGIEVLLTVAGDDLSDLNRLDLKLPASPPYALRGRLRQAEGTWTFEPFEGRVGDSDLAGRLAYSTGEPKASLSADLSSKLLDFDDLGPLIGAPPKTGPGETAAPKQSAQAAQVKASERVLPDKPLGMDSWTRLDADVRYHAQRVKRPDALPIDALATHLVIKQSTLRLQPLDFEIAGGKVKADIAIDSRPDPPRARADFDVRNISLAKLLPELGKEKVAVGTLYGRAILEGQGSSIAQLLGSADGDVTLMVNGGEMSALLLEAAGLDIGEVVKFLTIQDRPVPLRCAILDLHAEQGRAETELFVIDTEDTVFIGEGWVDLAKEQIEVTVHPRPKDQSILALRSPLHVSGTLGDPSAGIQAGPLAAKGTAAVLLGMVNPLLAILPLIETGPGSDSDCGRFGERVRATPQPNAPEANEAAESQ